MWRIKILVIYRYIPHRRSPWYFGWKYSDKSCQRMVDFSYWPIQNNNNLPGWCDVLYDCFGSSPIHKGSWKSIILTYPRWTVSFGDYSTCCFFVFFTCVPSKFTILFNQSCVVFFFSLFSFDRALTLYLLHEFKIPTSRNTPVRLGDSHRDNCYS